MKLKKCAQFSKCHNKFSGPKNLCADCDLQSRMKKYGTKDSGVRIETTVDFETGGVKVIGTRRLTNASGKKDTFATGMKVSHEAIEAFGDSAIQTICKDIQKRLMGGGFEKYLKPEGGCVLFEPYEPPPAPKKKWQSEYPLWTSLKPLDIQATLSDVKIDGNGYATFVDKSLVPSTGVSCYGYAPMSGSVTVQIGPETLFGTINTTPFALTPFDKQFFADTGIAAW